MNGLRRFFRRLVNVILPNREEAGLDREIASHLLLLEDEYRRRGQSAEEARRSARLILGSVEQARELHREARSFQWLDNARRDASYALRMLRRHPIATTTAILSLAVGIGLNAAVFSVMDWVLLRPLPYSAPHELVRVFTAGTAPLTNPSALTHDEFVSVGAATAFRTSAAFTTATRVMSASGMESIHVAVARVAGDMFGTLGAYPRIGRTFSPAEMAAGTAVIVLGHDLWLRRFSGDPAIAGRTVMLDGQPHMVIGIMPSGRGYPAQAEVWRPLTAAERGDDDRELDMVARLRSEASLARASTEIATLTRVASKGARTAWVDELQRTTVANVSATLQALFAAAMLTLLIVCANVAALVGARSADRVEEMAIRGALGATRGRVLGQLMVESVILALVGGTLGLLLGQWTLTFLVGIAPVSIPRLTEITLDGRIVGIGLAASLFTGLLVGLSPAIRLSRLTGGSGLRCGGAQRVTMRSNVRRALVLVQIAMAVVLTAGAGLLAQTLQRLIAIDHGFAVDRLVAVDLYLRGVFDGDSGQLFRKLIAETEALPGVASVAVSMGSPANVIGLRSSVKLAGETTPAASAIWRTVSPGYFDTAGIPVIAGRRFTSSDSPKAPRVGIANEALVRQLLAGRTAVGARLSESIYGDDVSIVGVVADVTPAGEPDRPALYVPVDQFPIRGGCLLIRTQNDPRAILPVLASRLRAAVPELAMDRVKRVAETLEASRAVTRFSTQVAAVFAGLALLLSVIGVYGLTAGEVSARWRELAVRLALGASHRDALWTVIRPCAAILSGGAVIGILGVMSVSPALKSLLHGIGATDASTLAFAAALLAIVGMLAAIFAAARVLRADPAATLRSE